MDRTTGLAVDGVEANFDSDLSKIFCCGGGSIKRCFVMTPGAFGSGTSINASTATNTVAESGDGLAGSVVQASFDSSTSGQHVWAVWNRSTIRQLPAPGTPALLVAAALATACTRRRGGAGAHRTS